MRERGVDFLHPLDLFQLALSLRCLARLGTEAIGEALQTGNFSLLVFVGGKMLFLSRRFLRDVAVPIAAIPVQTGVRDLDHFL